MMNTFLVGEASERHRQLHAAAKEAIEECEAQLRPGATMHDVFMAHARVLDAHGLQAHRMNACGYAMGTCFAPNWMDWPMFYEGNPVELKPGMTFFIHIIIANSDEGLGMTLGRSSLVGESGPEVLSQRPLDLVVR
jgi:Xaa-Pro dipeptidase